MSGTVTIIAVTGAQQSAVASRFSEAGWTVRGTSRKAGVTASGPALIADPETGEGLMAALETSDVVVLTLPQDHRSGVMPRVAANVARAARDAGVKRIVFNMAGMVSEDGSEPLFVDMRAARDAVREAGVPFVILQPTVFMDNLLAPWSLPSIVENGLLAYPAPETARISWISHRSLADFIYAAATVSAAAGRDLRIGGPEALTADELCKTLGQRLDKKVSYQRIPLEGFAAGLDHAFGPPAGQRIASIYARLSIEPDAMSVDRASADLLGVNPESFAAFTSRQDW